MLRIKLVASSALMTLARSPFATSAAQSFAKSNPIRSNQLAKPRKHVECPCHREDALRARLRTFVVEVHGEVVGQERQDDAGGDGLFQGSQPQGEEELVGRNLAHGSNFDHRAPIVPHAEQPRSGAIGVDLQSYEAVRR